MLACPSGRVWTVHKPEKVYAWGTALTTAPSLIKRQWHIWPQVYYLKLYYYFINSIDSLNGTDGCRSLSHQRWRSFMHLRERCISCFKEF